jgi:hypothetical protein
MPFFAEGGQGELAISGLGTGDLSGVLLPCVFATLAACSCAAFSLKHPACVNVAFSHAKASHWSPLMVITSLVLGIFMVA